METVPIIVAIWGAITGTVSLVWNISRERMNIDIKFQRSMRLVGSAPTQHDTTKPYFVLTVINKGRRPIKITKAGCKDILGNGKLYGIFTDSFVVPADRVLTETNPATDFLVQADLMKLENIDFLWIEDGTGKVYRKQIRSFPTFYRIFRKLQNHIKL